MKLSVAALFLALAVGCCMATNIYYPEIGEAACSDESNLDNFQWYEDDGSFGCHQAENEYCTYVCRCHCGEDGIVINNMPSVEDCPKDC